MSDENKNEIVGKPFDELSEEEMAESQGSGDVNQETTPFCVIAITAASVAAVTAIVNKK